MSDSFAISLALIQMNEANAVIICVPLIKAKPSFAFNFIGAKLNFFRADLVETNFEKLVFSLVTELKICTFPFSSKAKTRWANGAKSPLDPTEPWDGIAGIIFLLINSISNSKVSKRMPE